MTVESELAPNLKMIEDYNAVSSSVAGLQREAFKLGANFKTIGYALTNAQHSVALARGTRIVVSDIRGKARPHINVSDLDPNRLVELLRDLEEATKKKEMLFASLREIGAPVH